MSSLSIASAPLTEPAEPLRDAVNLAYVGRTLKIRWRWIVLPTLAALIGSFAFVNLVTPRYTAEAKLLLEGRDSFYTRPGQERAEQQPLIDEQAVASQVQVAISRARPSSASALLEIRSSIRSSTALEPSSSS